MYKSSFLLLLTTGLLSLYASARFHSIVDRLSLRRARLSKPHIPASIVLRTRKTQIQYNVLKEAWYYPRGRDSI